MSCYYQELVKPSKKYYQDKFNDLQGDVYKLKKAVYGAQIFVPFFVKQAYLNTLKLLAGNLKFFGHKKFIPYFIEELKKQIVTLKEEATKVFDWESVGNSKQN